MPRSAAPTRTSRTCAARVTPCHASKPAGTGDALDNRPPGLRLRHQAQPTTGRGRAGRNRTPQARPRQATEQRGIEADADRQVEFRQAREARPARGSSSTAPAAAPEASAAAAARGRHAAVIGRDRSVGASALIEQRGGGGGQIPFDSIGAADHARRAAGATAAARRDRGRPEVGRGESGRPPPRRLSRAPSLISQVATAAALRP